MFYTMAKIFYLLALCLTAVAGLPAQERIVNGAYTTISQYRFMAAVMLTTNNVNYRHICGGTILNNRSVLSAAHCFYPFQTRQIGIRVGSTFASYGGNFYYASNIFNFPNYNPVTQNHDIGIVRISTAFVFGPNVQIGSISGPNYNLGDNQAVWAAGWGLTTTPPAGLPSDTLRHVQVYTVNQGVCARDYGTLQPHMLCAGGANRGVCSGDSGGPLVHNNIVVGVTSNTALPCGRFPAIFARVSSYTQWITSNA